MKVKNVFHAEELFGNFNSLISPTIMKKSISAVAIAAFLLINTASAQSQSGSTPKKFLDALAEREFRQALALAKTVDEPDFSDKSGVTLLMYAAEAGSAEVCSALLARGADHGRCSANGTTALYLAARTDIPGW